MLITLTQSDNKIQVMFNGITHIQFYKRDFIALQTFIEDNGYYTLEIYLKRISEPLKCEYTKRDTWEQVIKLLSEL